MFRREFLLPVAYFHLVFTLPHELNALTLINKQEVCDLLFKAVAETLLEFGRRHLGGKLGVDSCAPYLGSDSARPFLVTPGFELYLLGREAVGVVLARTAAGDAGVVKAGLCCLGESGGPFRVARARS